MPYLRVIPLVGLLYIGCAGSRQSSGNEAKVATLRMAVRVEFLFDWHPSFHAEGEPRVHVRGYYAMFQTRDHDIVDHRINQIPAEFSKILVDELRQSDHFEWVGREDSADNGQYDLLLIWRFAGIGGRYPSEVGEATAHPLLNGDFRVVRTSDNNLLYKGGNIYTHHFAHSPHTFFEHHGKADKLFERGARITRDMIEDAINASHIQ